MRRLLLCLLLALAASPALAKTLKPERRIEATDDFAGKKDGKPARDVSGLACMPPVAGQRRCLLINDENRAAQFATLSGGEITPREMLPLLGDTPSPATLGAPPHSICPKPGGFTDLDGEAVAFADSVFYVAGSHGCSRNKGEFRLSAFHLARIRVDAAGRPAGPVELTYRLSDMLLQAGEAGASFGRSLKESQGLNIEGIAVTGDTLWAGLRAPSIRSQAVLVGASLADLFAPGSQPAQTRPQVVMFPAGPDRGIRDLAALADGRLLALIGPTQEQDLPYSLILVDLRNPAAPKLLGDLPSRIDAKAESVTLLAERTESLSVLIAYDGPKNGHISEYRLSLK